MGSPLRILRANIFMGCVEEEVFRTINNQIINIVIKTSAKQVKENQTRLKELSGLNITTENNKGGTMSFLDILVKQERDKFITGIYMKKTKSSHCLDGTRECPQKYKNSAIVEYIRSSLTHMGTRPQYMRTRPQYMGTRPLRIRKIFGSPTEQRYNKQDIDKQAKMILNQWHNTEQDTPNNKKDINL